MDQRERFEAWFVRYRHNRPSAGYGDLYAAWQAAEAAALERAIRVTALAKTTNHACDAIRALMDSGKRKTVSTDPIPCPPATGVSQIAYCANLAAPVERGGDKS